MAKNLDDILADSEFQKLPFEDKRQVLAYEDQEFGSLPDTDQKQVMNALGAGVLPEETPIVDGIKEMIPGAARTVLNAIPGAGVASDAVQAGLKLNPPEAKDIPAILATGATMGAAPIVGGGVRGTMKLAAMAASAGGAGKSIQQSVSGEQQSIPEQIKEGAVQGAVQVGSQVLSSVVEKSGRLLGEEGIDMARRALGFQKSQMFSTKSWRESLRKMARANKAAEEMLVRDVIPSTGSPKEMAKRASKILDESGAQLNHVFEQLESAQIKADPMKMAYRLIDEIDPVYPDQQKAVQGLLDDIAAFQKNPTFKAADKLKTRWQKIGFEDRTVGTEASKIYRKGAKILDKEIADTITFVSKDLGDFFRSAKKNYGLAMTAMQGISNKMSQEAGNSIVSLPTAVLSAGRLASGDVLGAAGSVGVFEGLRRRGAAVVAKPLYGLRNLSLSPNISGGVARSLLSERDAE